MKKEKYEVYWCSKGRFGECVRLVGRGRQRISQDDIEEFMHHNLPGEYRVVIYKGYEEWYPRELNDVVELYDLGEIAKIAIQQDLVG